MFLKADEICSQIDKRRKDKVLENRKKLLPVTKTVIFCGKQEIGFRSNMASRQ